MDAASDNRGKGKNKQTYVSMCGRNGLMHGKMIEEDGWAMAEEYLRSLGLYEAMQQLFDGRDLEVPPEAAIAEEEGQIEGRRADGVRSTSLALGLKQH